MEEIETIIIRHAVRNLPIPTNAQSLLSKDIIIELVPNLFTLSVSIRTMELENNCVTSSINILFKITFHVQDDKVFFAGIGVVVYLMKIESATSKFNSEDVKQEASPLIQCIEDNLQPLLGRLKIREVIALPLANEPWCWCTDVDHALYLWKCNKRTHVLGLCA